MLTICLASTLSAQDTASNSPTETDATEMAALQDAANQFVAAFDKGDAKTIGQMWTTDAEYVNADGKQFDGRETIEKQYADFLDAHKGTKLKVSIIDRRLLSPTVAIEEGTTSLHPLPQGSPARGHYLAILIKEDGQWLLASVREFRKAIPSTFDKLQGLAWLVGDWTAEQAGEQIEIDCEWTAHKSYLERRFTVTRGPHVVSSSIELIGWDPVDNKIKSWTFSSGGSHSIGLWETDGGNWLVRNHRVSAAGEHSATTDLWSLLPDGALGWRFMRMPKVGVGLAEGTEIVLKQKK